VQQSARVIGRSIDVIVNCPASDDQCYVYKLAMLMSQVPGNSSSTDNHRRRIQSIIEDDAFHPVHGRKLQCLDTGGLCNTNSDCCSNKCGESYYGLRCADSCFPGDATVELADGTSVAMNTLRLGDRIKVVSSSGDIKAEPALFWLHRSPAKHSSYLHIKAMNVDNNSTTTLRISPNHFLPISSNGEAPVYSTSFMAPAMDVQTGWWVWVKSSDASSLSPALVTDVSRELHQGAYSIMTESGTVIVNGVAASNHADIIMRDGSLMCEMFASKRNIPAYQHAFLAPVRVAAKVLGPKAMEALSSKSVNSEGSLSVSFGMAVRNVIAWAKGF
jgi:hypothetical protein